MAGGSLEPATQLEMQSSTGGGKESEPLTIPATFSQAEMGAPLILSSGWLAEQVVNVCPYGKVLLCHGGQHISWAWGRGVQPIPWRPREFALGTIPCPPPQQPPAMGTTLSVPIQLHTAPGGVRLLCRLVDTGTEYNICRMGRLPESKCKKAQKPLSLMRQIAPCWGAR